MTMSKSVLQSVPDGRAQLTSVDDESSRDGVSDVIVALVTVAVSCLRSSLSTAHGPLPHISAGDVIQQKYSINSSTINM